MTVSKVAISVRKLAALLDEMLAETGGPMTLPERRTAERDLGIAKRCRARPRKAPARGA